MPDRRGVLYCLAVFLAARVLLSLLGWAGIRETTPPPGADDGSGVRSEQIAAGPGSSSPATPGIHNLLEGTQRWDADWFLYIAREGYASERSAAFFPGYPLLVRMVDELTPVGTLTAALLVSNLSYLAAILVLYALTVREYGDDALARRTVILLTFFPTSFFFLAPYSEATYLLMSLLAFVAVRSRRWVSGGLAGAVAWLFRSSGGMLVPALVVEGWRRPEGRIRRVGATLLSALGFIAFLGWWWLARGDPLHPFSAQSSWYREPAFPLTTLGRGVAVGLRAVGDSSWLPEAGDLALTTIALVALAAGWHQLPSIGYAVYAGLGFALPLAFAVPARPLLSMPRFVIVLFPIAWAAATRLNSPLRFRVVVILSASGWAALVVALSNWRFVA